MSYEDAGRAEAARSGINWGFALATGGSALVVALVALWCVL